MEPGSAKRSRQAPCWDIDVTGHYMVTGKHALFLGTHRLGFVIGALQTTMWTVKACADTTSAVDLWDHESRVDRMFAYQHKQNSGYGGSPWVLMSYLIAGSRRTWQHCTASTCPCRRDMTPVPLSDV
jgi:hypothetical protein